MSQVPACGAAGCGNHEHEQKPGRCALNGRSPIARTAFRSANVTAHFDPKMLEGLWYEQAYMDIAQKGSSCQVPCSVAPVGSEDHAPNTAPAAPRGTSHRP